MARTRKRRVNLPALNEPEFLSLVDKPANRSGFKMIRSEDGALVKVRSRLKRTDQNLLSIDLPAGISREAAESIMELFGMADEYEIQERGDNAYTLHRVNSDLDEAKTVAISLGEGIIANVATESFIRADTPPDYERERTSKGTDSNETKTEEDYGDGFTLSRIVFTTTTWETVETVREWLQRNDIDFLENGVEVTQGEIIVSRNETEADGYRVPIAEGVVGVLELSEKEDIPKSIHKTVLANLLEPFGEQERSDKPTTESADMPTKDQETKDDKAAATSTEEKRTDTETKAEGKESTTTEPETEQLTREDVAKIAAEAAVAAIEAALAKRSEEDQKDEGGKTSDILKGLAEKVDTLGSSIEGIRKDVDDLGDTTVTRSESEDDEQHEKREDEESSVFAGMFG